MQKFIVLALLSISITFTYAKCSSSGIWCWPNQRNIKTNAIFILNFYDHSQSIVSQIGKKHSIYLRSGKQKLPLIIKEIHKGAFKITQILLKPLYPLIAGIEYEIFIDSLPEYSSIEKFNPETNRLETAKWIVSNCMDTESPVWTEWPTCISKTMVAYGCGPAKWVNFSFGYRDSSDILIKAIVKSLQTKKETTYYLQKVDNKVKIGHGMCSGAFYFNQGNKYEVTFSLMDQSGNVSKHNPKPITFSRPYVLTQSE